MSEDRWLSLTHDRDDGWIVQLHPTREAAEARVAEWLEECGAWAATQGDGWPEEMDAYVVSVAAALRETSWEDEETAEPFAEYRMEAVPDPRDARIAELEAEVERLRTDPDPHGKCRSEGGACQYYPWTRLECVYTADDVISVTAARSEDGIGVVASWDLRDGEWCLSAWADTEGGSGDGDNQEAEEPIPQVPPACLLRVPGGGQ